MKALTIIIGFILTQQVLQAQNILTSGKQVIVRYHGANTAEDFEADSVRKAKLYNLLIIKNFPVINSEVKTLLAMDDSSLSDFDEICRATVPCDKGPLKNIKWAPAKTTRKN